MARVPSKHGREQALDFQGFLNDLQDWELSIKDKDKKMKPEALHNERMVSHAMSGLSSSFMGEESFSDATSEKELGNEFFKQKKFKEAIDCYSRSIVFSPTAVAYANRAMAYIKIKRFKEAEEDCTEALNLDDRYIKAYSRRATARKELQKLKEAIEDAEFALRLEPQNQEVKKQYAELKSLYEKEIIQKASGAIKNSTTKAQKMQKSEIKASGHVGTVKEDCKKNVVETPAGKLVSVEEVHDGGIGDGNKNQARQMSGAHATTALESNVDIKRNYRANKQELNASIQKLASRAASRALSEAAKSITPPTSAFQFEVSWRGLSGDRSLQAHLLKVTSPSALPQIFKSALTAPMLIDIIKCVASFFTEGMDLAIKFLENLTKVPRFDMLIMCLSSAEKTELRKIWDEVFCDKATPIEYAEILEGLRSKYCLKQ